MTQLTVPVIPLEKKLEADYLIERNHNYPSRSVEAVKVEGSRTNILATDKSILGGVKTYWEIFLDTKLDKDGASNFESPYSPADTLGLIFTLGLYSLSSGRKSRVKSEREFWEKVREYRKHNLLDAAGKTKNIRVHQLSLSDLEKELGKPVERVDTGRSESFITAGTTLDLRMQAYRLGANAVACYQPGSAIGTPVKILEE